MRASVILLTLGILMCVSGCEQHKSKPSETLKIVSSNGQTYLLDEQTRKVFGLRNGEFVQMATVSINDIAGKKALKLFAKDIPNFSAIIFLKYRSGQIYYQVTIFPALIGAKPKVSNWADYLRSPSNSLKISLQDKQGFGVQSIEITFGGPSASPRTNIVDEKGKNNSVEFDGVLQANASAFELISDATVTYNLDPPAGYQPPLTDQPTQP